MKVTLADARDSIAEVIGCCATDARVAKYINEATQRLLYRGRWRGTVQRYRVCMNIPCITWPRQIETVEAFSICDGAGVIRGEDFEFLPNGPGQLKSNDNWGTICVDRGEAIAFDDVIGSNKKLKVYADVPEDADAKLFVQYYDNNGNWVRTFTSEWNNGEYISIGTTPSYSSSVCMQNGWVGVQKPITNGVVRVYEYDTSTGFQRPLAIYEPDETRPQYRRSFVPGLQNMGLCSRESESDSDCSTKSLTILGKLRFIPVLEDTDYIMIPNLPSLIDMVQSVLKRKRNLIGEAASYEASAINELQNELRSYKGSQVSEIKFAPRDIWGGGMIENFIQ